MLLSGSAKGLTNPDKKKKKKGKKKFGKLIIGGKKI